MLLILPLFLMMQVSYFQQHKPSLVVQFHTLDLGPTLLMMHGRSIEPLHATTPCLRPNQTPCSSPCIDSGCVPITSHIPCPSIDLGPGSTVGSSPGPNIDHVSSLYSCSSFSIDPAFGLTSGLGLSTDYGPSPTTCSSPNPITDKYASSDHGPCLTNSLNPDSSTNPCPKP
ncbi:hypothetical protein VNO77_21703 [Canavalia gladiata]|uniref:Uncharacterized protein n=1 Tax=Canavalia gladiata TaxID=3824 RepID=A0AAN9QAD6_CANGL